MIKKIVIGGAAAGLLVAGAASAAKLGGVSDKTLASGQVTVSGTTLDSIQFENDWIGATVNGKYDDKVNVVKTIHFDFADDAEGLYVEFGVLDENGKWKGYYGPDSPSYTGLDPAKFVIGAGGKVSVSIPNSKPLLTEQLGELDIVVTSDKFGA